MTMQQVTRHTCPVCGHTEQAPSSNDDSTRSRVTCSDCGYIIIERQPPTPLREFQ